MPDLNDRPIVLLVDDEIELRDIVKESLSEHGFLVVAADSAAEARYKLHASRTFPSTEIDIIISDIRMPNETGLDLLHHLREAKDSIPFLLISGHFEIDNQTAQKLGADGVFAKPFKTASIAAKIRSVLADRKNRT